ncbi:MAG: FAD-dependent oxidoreductase [Pseudomonadota bacterium]
MTLTDQYDVLFEPVRIGPVMARNRFYQVPHCCGMGHLRPQAHAAMRRMKAMGGWAVVSTEEAEIHPSSDLSPYAEQRIWDKRDIPALRLMTDGVHEHGALAAIELAHNGSHAANLYSRIPSIATSHMATDIGFSQQARRAGKKDLRDFRQWHKAAALRAKEAGFDIIYVYAGHRMTLTQQFLLPQFNDRTDEYGGSLENRVRLIRELLEDTKDAVGDTCAVAFRFAVDEMLGSDGMQAAEEGRAVVELLADLPDLWDVNVSDWSNDSMTTRFQPDEGYQLPYTSFVKSVTSKPVVSVGKFTSPDKMVSMVKDGVLDFIGAARPSIADPFLPQKIQQRRTDDIRECIGCNICVASDNLGVSIRCTQNPTMGEEWRRGWHPEKIALKAADAHVLVVGGGPAGLESAVQLARRGYQVTLSEAKQTLGGRVLMESGLHGLAAWKRVSDIRIYELQQQANVSLYTESLLTVDDILEFNADHVVLATGSRWRTDGVGRSSRNAIAGLDNTQVLSPDDILQGALPDNTPVVIYDDDQCYLAGVIAEHLAVHNKKQRIVFVTPASCVSPWTDHTLEQQRVQQSLLTHNVEIITGKTVTSINDGKVQMQCVYTGAVTSVDCGVLIPVTERTPTDNLYESLVQQNISVELIGDAYAPGLIADAVYAGHMVARNFQEDEQHVAALQFLREIPALG